MVRLTWPRRATSRMDSMMSLPGVTLTMTSFIEGSAGWPTGKEVVLGLFLEPGGLPRGFLVGGVAIGRFSRGWFAIGDGGQRGNWEEEPVR